MKGNIKRSDVQITNQKIIAYCKRENKLQVQVYKPKIDAGKMSALSASTYFLIIEDLSKLATALEKRRISWQQLFKMVEDLPVSRRGIQGNLFLNPNKKE